MRKGRFDEIFFVDLPSPEIRKAIVKIHLENRGQSAANFNLGTIAAAMDGFSGAEIEQALVSALYTAYANKTQLNNAHILGEIQKTRPLSVVMSEKIGALRHWAAGRTVTCD